MENVFENEKFPISSKLEIEPSSMFQVSFRPNKSHLVQFQLSILLRITHLTTHSIFTFSKKFQSRYEFQISSSNYDFSQGMGGQLGYWGLWIDASFEFGNCSPSCSTYAGYKMLSGSPVFTIAGLEVWCAEGIYNLSDENGSTVNSVTDYLNKVLFSHWECSKSTLTCIL